MFIELSPPFHHQIIHKETVACAFTCAVSKCVGCVGEVIEGSTAPTSTHAKPATPTSTPASTTTPASTPASPTTPPVTPRDAALPPGLKEDWTEFFSQPIYNILITLFVDVASENFKLMFLFPGFIIFFLNVRYYTVDLLASPLFDR